MVFPAFVEVVVVPAGPLFVENVNQEFCPGVVPVISVPTLPIVNVLKFSFCKPCAFIENDKATKDKESNSFFIIVNLINLKTNL